MKVYTIQINYNSGIYMTAEFTKFSIDSSGAWEWKVYDPTSAKPLRLGVDSVESVWQLSVREVQEDQA